jgi:hypothetical protein
MLYPAGVPEFDGPNMLPTSQALLAPWGDKVRIHAGMIEDQSWDEAPIEILIVDAGKNTMLCDSIAKTFFRSLIPGKSLVVHQDYMHHKQPWLAVQMELMSEYFEPVAYCAPDTVVFLNTRQIDDAALDVGRTDNLEDKAFMNTLRAARKTFDPLDIAVPFKAIIEAVKANPSVRNAHQME